MDIKCGIEIHQQLDAKHKLFCDCPITKSESFPLEVQRKLRAVAGELGGFDPAALYEFLRGRKFIYKINPESSCMVELDEEPPKPMNKEALRISVQICKMLRCRLVDEVHVMRKTVLDGSSVSGFQRTALIGYDGHIDTSFGKVGIQTVCLEEDSAPAVSKEKGAVVYRLDRLGIPLAEIATDASLKTPEQVKEAAEKIGFMLRSVPVVRGIGSIRQDVNVSIRNGARVEIKGFQELEKIPKLVRNEVERQKALLEIRDELKKRGSRNPETKKATSVFAHTNCRFIKKILEEKGDVIAILLPGFSGLLKKEVGDRTFGRELSSYAEAYGFGIIHSDEELGKYDLDKEFENLRKRMGAKEQDLVLIIAGKSPEKAVDAVVSRASYCLKGVPEETRVSDGIGSKYTRPLPGSERMYPETDIPPVKIDAKGIKPPKTLLEREKELDKLLPKELSGQLIRSRYYELFEELNREFDMPVLIADVLLSVTKDLRREGVLQEPNKEDLKDILSLVKKKKIPNKAVSDSLAMLAQGKTIKDVENKFRLLSEKEIESIVSDIVKQNPEKNESALMGIAMDRIRGRADGKTVFKLVRKFK